MVKSWLFDIFNYPYVPTAEGFDPQKCQELYDWHLRVMGAGRESRFRWDYV